MNCLHSTLNVKPYFLGKLKNIENVVCCSCGALKVSLITLSIGTDRPLQIVKT